MNTSLTASVAMYIKMFIKMRFISGVAVSVFITNTLIFEQDTNKS